MKTLYEEIQEMMKSVTTEYDNNVLIWSAIEKLAIRIDRLSESPNAD